MNLVYGSFCPTHEGNSRCPCRWVPLVPRTKSLVFAESCLFCLFLVFVSNRGQFVNFISKRRRLSAPQQYVVTLSQYGTSRTRSAVRDCDSGGIALVLQAL